MKSVFDKWFDEKGYDLHHKEFARIVWNAAISEARDLVYDRYDECEPWLEPCEVLELLSA